MARNNYMKSQKTNDKLEENVCNINCLGKIFKVLFTECLHCWMVEIYVAVRQSYLSSQLYRYILTWPKQTKQIIILFPL